MTRDMEAQPAARASGNRHSRRIGRDPRASSAGRQQAHALDQHNQPKSWAGHGRGSEAMPFRSRQGQGPERQRALVWLFQWAQPSCDCWCLFVSGGMHCKQAPSVNGLQIVSAIGIARTFFTRRVIRARPTFMRWAPEMATSRLRVTSRPQTRLAPTKCSQALAHMPFVGESKAARMTNSKRKYLLYVPPRVLFVAG